MKPLILDDTNSNFEQASFRDFGFAETGRSIEMHSIPKHRREKTLLELVGSDKDFYRETAATGSNKIHTDISETLPFIAEKYKISADLSDYVITAMPIVPSDLPNRNLVAFPFPVLTDFNPSLKMMQYKTWKGSPTYAEHDNKDYTKAKGVVFDVSLHRMRNSVDEIWKVITLCGFDRTKDPMLANGIMNGERDEYSMGAYVTGYTCSCCGAFAERPTHPTCAHVDPRRSKFNIFPVEGQPTLAYWNVDSFCGFEVSSVRDAAFKGAKAPAWRTDAEIKTVQGK